MRVPIPRPRRAAMAVAAALALGLTLTGCEAPSSGGDAGGGSGTFRVTGVITMHGSLHNVQCFEPHSGNYVAQGTADIKGGTVTVSAEIPASSPDDADQEIRNSLVVGGTTYNRSSMGYQPLSGHRDGQRLTVSAKLVDTADPANPAKAGRVSSWRTIVVDTQWDCAGQLGY